MPEQSIYDRPRTKQSCPPHKVAPRNTKQTLKELVNENETKNWRVSLLKEMSTRPTGPWREFHAFYVANQSGDVESFKPEGKKMITDMIRALDKEQSARLGEEDSDAVQKQSTTTQVSRNGKPGRDKPQDSQGVGQGKQGQETS